MNEPDNYAVEEALQIVDRVGGNVTVLTVGGDDDEEILRREMAMGAIEGAHLKVVRQEFGGQVNAHVRCDISSGAVLNIRPGAFKPLESAVAGGTVVDKSSAVGALEAGRRYLETVVAEAGAVDITKHQVLVSIGRGIQEKDNVAIAEELADALGAAVSCSRPVVDAKWLEKSRQVGSSGQTVKPKVYLACGISGSSQQSGRY